MTNLLDYCRKRAPALLKAPQGQLKHPYVVPGAGMYENQLWDWDSYWSTRALLALTRQGDAPLRRRVWEHGRGCLQNFLDHQAASGAVPILIAPDNPDAFHCLDAPDGRLNQAKPVLAQFALLLAEEAGEFDWLAPLHEPLQRFHRRWEERYRSDVGLLVWGSDVATGVDNDPTTYGRPEFSSANLLLNCLYIADLEAMAAVSERLGRTSAVADARARAARLGELVRAHCWDARDRFFYTVDVQCRDRRAELIPGARRGMDLGWSSLPLRIQMFTGFLPLWCGAATKEQAEILVAEHYRNPDTFFAPAGVRTLSRREPMYSLAASSNPSNWIGPVWGLPNYLVWRGLRRYGFATDATELARKTVRLFSDDLASSGTLHEYYNPETRQPIMNPGFMDWNALAIEMIAMEDLATP